MGNPDFNSLTEVLRHRATHEPNRRAYVFLQDGEIETAALTYAELDRQARAIAAQLQGRARPAARALMLYPPGLEFVTATWLPSFHDMGLVDGILQPVYAGFLGVILPPAAFLQSPVRWLQAITRYGGTHSGGPNFGYDLCVRKVTSEQRATLDLRTWVSAYNGAEPVHHATLARFAETFQPAGFQSRYTYPCYGMAEATLIITGGRLDAEPVIFSADADALEEHRVVAAGGSGARKRDVVGCGRPWCGTRVEIVHPETRRRCPPEEVGEIWTSGPSVAQGYWKRPAETQDTFGAQLADSGEGPFLRTGDLGFMRAGEVFVTGRIKDMIIIRGLNYYPQDVEKTVQAR